MIASQLELHRLNTGMQPRVVTSVTLLKHMLFKHQGHVSAALVLGGCDLSGAHLYQIYPHGSTGKLPYTTMGSGSLAAMSVFECGYKDDMTEAEAIEVTSSMCTDRVILNYFPVKVFVLNFNFCSCNPVP